MKAVHTEVRHRGHDEKRKSVLVVTQVDNSLYKRYREARRNHKRIPEPK